MSNPVHSKHAFRGWFFYIQDSSQRSHATLLIYAFYIPNAGTVFNQYSAQSVFCEYNRTVKIAGNYDKFQQKFAGKLAHMPKDSTCEIY